MWISSVFGLLRLYNITHSCDAGPCITNVFATRRKNFSQWHRSFQRKLLSHWLKFFRHVAITLVIQGPGYRLECLVINVALWNIFYRCVADGFIPAPTLEMTFDGRSMHIQQNVSEHLETSSNHPDYKYRVFRAVAVTEGPLEMQVEDNRMPLKCKATVRDTGSVVETMIRPVLESKISGWNWGMLRPM